MISKLRACAVLCVACSLAAAIHAAALGTDSQADEPRKLFRPQLRFGVLFWHDSPNDEAAFTGIREALEETGLPHEFMVRRADSDAVKAARALEEFKAAPVDLIFAMGTWAARHAAGRITEIPIVFTAVTNPVESGIVPSWAGSGRNIAGNSNWIPPERLLHFFRLAVPDLKRLGILRSSVSGDVSAAELRDMREYLAGDGAPPVTIVEQVVGREADIPDAADLLAAAEVDAVWIPIDLLIYSNLRTILRSMEPHGIPLLSSALQAAHAGAVAGVIVDYELLGQRAVVIAVDILEGQADPALLPVARMNAYKVVVNLDAARRCRYEVPLSLLVRADAILDESAGEGAAGEEPKAGAARDDSARTREHENE